MLHGFVVRKTTGLLLMFAISLLAAFNPAYGGESTAIQENAFGVNVKNRKIEGKTGDFSVSAKRICYWTKVDGDTSGTIRHVWSHNNVQTDDIHLKVSPGSFRTWSCKNNVAPGLWGVRTYNGKGELLRTHGFLMVDSSKQEDDRFSLTVYHDLNKLTKSPQPNHDMRVYIVQKTTTQLGIDSSDNITGISDQTGKELWSKESAVGKPWPRACSLLKNKSEMRAFSIPKVDPEVKRIAVQLTIRVCERDRIMEKELTPLVVGKSIEHVYGSAFILRQVYALEHGGGLNLILALSRPTIPAGEAISRDWLNFSLVKRNGASEASTFTQWYSEAGTDMVRVIFYDYDSDYKEDRLSVSYDEPKELRPLIFDIADFPNPWLE